MDRMKTELVITGLGLVLPCGDGVERARASWLSQKPCFDTLPDGMGPGRGGVCSQFSSAGIIPPMQNRRLDRASRFAWVAAHQAFLDAGLNPAEAGPRIGISVGTMTGGDEATEGFLRPYLTRGPEGASPLLFPNCVAVAISGHLSIAFGIKGPSITQLAREASTLAALDQAARWIQSGLVEAMLVVGADGLFPLLPELLYRSRMVCRQGDPVVGSRKGMLMGEGAQAFILENRGRAEARGAHILARLQGVACCAPASTHPHDRSRALVEAATSITPIIPDAWIGGSSGLRILDDIEAPLHPWNPKWPRAKHPKTLWGEFCGSGGQLLAAALLEDAARCLVTAPASFGGQYAAVVEMP